MIMAIWNVFCDLIDFDIISIKKAEIAPVLRGAGNGSPPPEAGGILAMTGKVK